jgi:TonB-linked SusC/RagA family outer membrane protein
MMKRWAFLLMLALLPAGNAWGQATGQVTGTVTDATGAPVSGATVAVEGTGRGSQTAADGRYTITGVPAGTHVVHATKIGYGEKTQTVSVAAGQAATADFQLTAQVIQLERLVAVGYGTARVKDVTGAVASVSEREVQEVATPSVGEALKGRVPGLQVTTSGYTPGSNPTIRIRGMRSLTASNDPLIVVDGVAISGGLGDINPGSIESVEVLKDASATAIYGSRGANGVVLITTKRGQAGHTSVTYDVRYGTEQIHKLIKPFSGPEYAQFKREAARTAGKYQCPEGVTQCQIGDEQLFSALELENLAAGNYTDYVDLIARNGSLQEHQLTVSGGNENTRFSIGGNYLDENGVTIAQNFLRRGANVSLDHTSGKLHAGLSANVTNQLRNLGRGDGLWGGAFNINPLGLYKDEEGNLIPTPIPDGQSWNPLLDAQNWDRETLRTRTFGNAFVGYEIFPGVTLQSTFGADMAFERDAEFRGACTQPNRCSSNNGWVDRNENFNWVSTNTAQIDRQLNDANRVSATLLYEIQNETFDYSRADVQNVPYEYQKWYNLATAANINGVRADYRAWLLQSFMGRLNYTLLDRYYLTVTGREDCSSRLAPGNKCEFFPSAALKWRLSDEGFMQNQGLFSDLSIRASYGVTGNTSIDPYQTQGSLTKTVYSFGGTGAFGFRPNDLANADLSWEKTATYDVGLEFGMFDNRISGTVDGYVGNTYDLLMPRQLPYTTGYSGVLQNVGKTKNSGLELSLSTVNLENFHGLRWTSDLNWATNRNEIVSLYGGTEDDVGSGWFIGQPIQVFYDYKFAGIWQADEAEEAAKYGETPGMIHVADLNGRDESGNLTGKPDGQITSDDRVIIGRQYNFPKWTGAFSNRFEYGSFDLSGLITARWGYTVRATGWPGALAGRYNQVRINYWTPENPSNEFPRPNSDQESALYASAVQLMDASNWRVRNITLGWNVPSAITSRLGANSSLRLYAQAQDPWVFTDYIGFDPEMASTSSDPDDAGEDGLGVPSYRTFLIGATVSF